MHCPWRRKTRAWGYEVIRAIEEDDPLRLTRAFKRPAELVFVDLNAQVESDYGGYAWTEWMHEYFGDTALHIALKWKRHRAVKAVLSLRPSWTIRNEAGTTAGELVPQVYGGKTIVTLKDEQEHEYENAAMYAEEDAMIRLMAAEHEIRERTRLRKLNELHTARTIGTRGEASILFECGRVLATEAVQYRSRAVLPCGIVAGRWASHICRELRRNRFAAQRGAMRRKVVPTTAPSVVPPSPQQPTRQGQINAKASAQMSPMSRGETSSREWRSHTRHKKGRGGLNSGDAAGGGVASYDARSYFDAALSARGSSHVEESSPQRRREAVEDGSVMSRPTSVGGSRSVWRGGKQDATSPRFDRSSRMAAMRATHILAAGKSAKRTSSRDRLQRKMATQKAPKALQVVVLKPAVGSPSERLTITTTANKAHYNCNEQNGSSKVEVPPSATGVCAMSVSKGLNSSNTENAGRGNEMAERDHQSLASAGDDDLAFGGAAIGSSPNNSSRAGFHDDVVSRRPPPSVEGAAASTACSPSRKHNYSAGATVDDNSGEELTRGVELSACSSVVVTRDGGISATNPSPPIEKTPQGNRHVPPTESLGDIPPGPMKDVLTALLTGTVIREDDGERVLAPRFSGISSQRELKYCGPMVVGVPSQASAMAGVLSARPGVLLHLNLAGKRLGNPGAAQLAPALPNIKKVDLRQNNIGDPGARAIAEALTEAALGERETGQDTLLCLVESLSLAGNRIGDMGGQALFEMVTNEKGVPPGLRWLSVAGNPCMSDSARRRLVSAGLHDPSNPLTVII